MTLVLLRRFNLLTLLLPLICAAPVVLSYSAVSLTHHPYPHSGPLPAVVVAAAVAGPAAAAGELSPLVVVGHQWVGQASAGQGLEAEVGEVAAWMVALPQI